MRGIRFCFFLFHLWERRAAPTDLTKTCYWLIFTLQQSKMGLISLADETWPAARNSDIYIYIYIYTHTSAPAEFDISDV